MKKIVLIGVVFLMMLTLAYAAERGTANEAISLVKKAVAFYNTNGEEKALAEFNNLNSKFNTSKDLYLSVYDMKGKIMAHGKNQKLVGMDMIDLKDSDGKKFIREFISKASSSSSGWVDYKWTDPLTKKITPKSAYFEKAGNLIISAGIYK